MKCTQYSSKSPWWQRHQVHIQVGSSGILLNDQVEHIVDVHGYLPDQFYLCLASICIDFVPEHLRPLSALLFFMSKYIIDALCMTFFMYNKQVIYVFFTQSALYSIEGLYGLLQVVILEY